jgi:hypothetical protein
MRKLPFGGPDTRTKAAIFKRRWPGHHERASREGNEGLVDGGSERSDDQGNGAERICRISPDPLQGRRP